MRFDGNDDEPPPPSDDDAPPGLELDSSPGGCATGECLPDEAPAAPKAGSLAATFAARIANAPAVNGRPAAPSAPTHGNGGATSTARGDAPGPAEYERWRQAVDAARAASPRHGKSLAFGRLVRMSEGEIVIAFTPEADFHRATVSGSGKATIEQILSDRLGRPTKLIIDLHAARTAPPSIAEEEAKERAAHERSVEGRVKSHPALQAAMRILGGELEHVQVLERERPAVVDAVEATDESA